MENETPNLLYFAYGEHMNENEMLRDFPKARMVGLTRLNGFSLCFVGRDGLARAAVEPGRNESVLGRVWSLQESDLGALDRIADDPYFARREIRMVSVDGVTVPVLTYITVPGQAQGRLSFVTYSIMREAYEAVEESLDAIMRKAVKCAR